MKILVTGAAGFIGFHLCRKLLEEGNKLIGIDNINSYYDTTLKEKRLENLKMPWGVVTYPKAYRTLDTPN